MDPTIKVLGSSDGGSSVRGDMRPCDEVPVRDKVGAPVQLVEPVDIIFPDDNEALPKPFDLANPHSRSQSASVPIPSGRLNDPKTASNFGACVALAD